jgi:hypothetical protein
VCCFFLDLFGFCVVSYLSYLVCVETTQKPNKSRKKQHKSQERNNTKAKQVKEETTHNPNNSLVFVLFLS